MNERIVFMGTTNFSGYILEKLLENNYNVVAVVSQPDRKIGRKQEIKPTITKEIALNNNIDVYSFENINDNYLLLEQLNIDVIITCAYGQKINKEILELPRYRSINVHASVLPKYRGASPITSALANGDEFTGNTIIYMEEKMDSGAIISSSRVAIDIEDTFTTLNEKLKIDAANLLLKTLPSFFKNDFKVIEQDENLVTYTKKLTRLDEFVDFNNDVKVVYDKMRSLIETPGCYAYLDNLKVKFYRIFYKKDELSNQCGEIFIKTKKYFEIACQNGNILVYDFQIEGRKRITFKEYLNGNKLLIQEKMIFNNGCEQND